MKYSLRVTPVFKKYNKKIKNKKLQNLIKEAILQIQIDPYYAGVEGKGDLSDIFIYKFNHSGVSYRISYLIEEDNGQQVIILLAGTRESFYEELKRYIN